MKPQKLILVLLVVLALTMRLIPGPRTIDDSYITFRYARNLLAGEGFVYNPGVPVQGTTTPLYTLLMTGLGALAGGTQADFPVIAWLFNAAADAAACILLWLIGKRVRHELAGLGAALVWSVAPYSVTFSIGGLETSLYVLLLTGLAYAYISQKRVLTGLLGALALLTRPDALIFLGPLMLDRFIRAVRPGLLGVKTEPERLQLGEVLAFVIPVAAWYGFATLTFGSPLPHSVQAKLLAYHLEAHEALIRLIQHYATPFIEQSTLGTKIAVGLGLVLYPFLYILGARRVFAAERRLLAWMLFPWLYFITFAIPNPLIFRWYLTPPLPAYFFFVLAGAGSLFKLNGDLRTALRRSWIAALIILLLPVGLSLRAWQLHPDHGPDRPAPGMAWFQLELLYREAAEFVAPQMNADTVLAAGDVGVLGYYTPARILDTVGLNSEEALSYYPLDEAYYVINYAVAPQLILDEQPDWVIILEVYGREGLLKNETFQQHYTLVKKLETDIYGSDGMLIFQRAR